MDLMIDLETLGTSSRAAVVQLGAIAFEPRGEVIRPAEEHAYRYNYPSLNRGVSLESSLKVGLEIDADTLRWWSRRDLSRVLSGGTMIWDALLQLTDLARVRPIQHVWSHGATFDCVIVAEAARLNKIALPWSFRDVRDTRTLFEIAESIQLEHDDPVWAEPEWFSDLVEHDALHDCARQVWRVQRAYAILDGRWNELKFPSQEDN